jgi:molybdopterin converting factor small subunit
LLTLQPHTPAVITTERDDYNGAHNRPSPPPDLCVPSPRFTCPRGGAPIPTVVVAPSLARWLTPTPTAGAGERALDVPGATVREVLEAVFALHPQLRGYVTDERGALRHHVVCFVNGGAVRDKAALAEPVPAGGEVHVFQALSGG